MNEIYLIWSNDRKLWWAAQDSGYSARVENAGHYSRNEALRSCVQAIPGRGLGAPLTEIPVREEDISEALARFKQQYPGFDPEPYEDDER